MSENPKVLLKLPRSIVIDSAAALQVFEVLSCHLAGIVELDWNGKIKYVEGEKNISDLAITALSNAQLARISLDTDEGGKK